MRALITVVAVLFCGQGSLQLPRPNTLADTDTIYSFSTTFSADGPAVVRIPPPGVKLPVEGATSPADEAVPTAEDSSVVSLPLEEAPAPSPVPEAPKSSVDTEVPLPTEETELPAEAEAAPEQHISQRPSRVFVSIPYLEGHVPALDHLGQYKFSTAF